MKIAIVQDWFTVNGGAEKVVKEIMNTFENVQPYSLIDFLNDSDRKDILKGKNAVTSFIQNLPFVKKYYRYYLPFFPRAIEQLDLRDYDVVISSSYAVAHGVLTSSNQIHICYCHTPMRYAWDLFHHYMEDFKVKGLRSWFIKRQLHRLRMWDYVSAQRVDYFVANSTNVAKRIKKTYQKESQVIYPPVEVDKFELQESKEDYYICASRLVPYKKNDLIIEAFNEMPDKKLIVVGDGPQLNYLKKISKKNIEIKGYLAREEVIQLMQNAKAMVLAAEEDFGITAVEAQACGTPVIALGSGGYLETVKEGETGVYFTSQSIASIMDAISVFEKDGVKLNASEIRNHALQFSNEIFKKEIKQLVNKLVDEHSSA